MKPRIAFSNMTGRIYYVHRWRTDGTAKYKVDITEEAIVAAEKARKWSEENQIGTGAKLAD